MGAHAGLHARGIFSWSPWRNSQQKDMKNFLSFASCGIQTERQPLENLKKSFCKNMRKAFKALSKKENINVKPPIVACPCGLPWFEEILTLRGREAELRGLLVLLFCWFVLSSVISSFLSTRAWTVIILEHLLSPFGSITIQAQKKKKSSCALLRPINFFDAWQEFTLWYSVVIFTEKASVMSYQPSIFWQSWVDQSLLRNGQSQSSSERSHKWSPKRVPGKGKGDGKQRGEGGELGEASLTRNKGRSEVGRYRNAQEGFPPFMCSCSDTLPLCHRPLPP